MFDGIHCILYSQRRLMKGINFQNNDLNLVFFVCCSKAGDVIESVSHKSLFEAFLIAYMYTFYSNLSSHRIHFNANYNLYFLFKKMYNVCVLNNVY